MELQLAPAEVDRLIAAGEHSELAQVVAELQAFLNAPSVLE